MPLKKKDSKLNEDNKNIEDELDNKYHVKLKVILNACNRLEVEFGIDTKISLEMFNIFIDSESLTCNRDKFDTSICHKVSVTKDTNKKCTNAIQKIINNVPDYPQSKIFCRNCYTAWKNESNKNDDKTYIYSSTKEDHGLLLPFNYVVKYIDKYKYRLGSTNDNSHGKKQQKYILKNVKETVETQRLHELYVKVESCNFNNTNQIDAYKWSVTKQRFDTKPVAHIKPLDESDNDYDDYDYELVNFINYK